MMMKTNYIRSIQYSVLAVAVLFVTATTLIAQPNTLYYMKTVSTRHELNPSFQPIPNGYYSTIPVMSGFSLAAGNNSFSLKDVLYPKRIDGQLKTVWFYNDKNSMDDFYNVLRKNLHVYTELDLRLFAFGMRILKDSYITVGLNTKFNSGIIVPKDLAKLLIYGTPDATGNNVFNLDRFGVSANLYTELALGYSQVIDKHLTVGGKLKFLLGHANVSTKMKKFRLNASKDRWNIELDGTINASIPNVDYELDSKDRIENIETDDMFDNFGFGTLSGGTGLAFDLGANYKLLDDKLTVSASIIDLGFIRWKAAHAANMPVSTSYDFEGVEITIEDGAANWDEDYFENIQDELEYSTTFNSYTSSLAAKVFLGAEYGILNQRLTFGGLSKSTIINRALFQEFTASVNYIPISAFNASISYSLMNGRFGTIGLGIGGRLGPVNIYFAGDYMTTSFAKPFIPLKNKSFNLQTGILFNFGYNVKKNADDDKDGVQNRNDKCPNTPPEAVVDKDGCPVDFEVEE
jgi:hypothetical protein